MRAWLCFIFFELLPVSLSVKPMYEGTDSMEQNNTEKRRRTGFGISFPTEILSKTTKNTQHQEYSNNKKKLFTTDNVVSRNQQRDLIIAPNLNDTCFRVYNEFIVVNAQPYERRSITQLEECKQRCMQSQSGVYSCRSFVYNVAKKICDFFTHQGDWPPAKLLKHYEHLYLEPIFDDKCVLKYAKKSKKTTINAAGRKLNNTMILDVLTKEDTKQETCENGKVAKYLKTHGFKLGSANRIDLRAYNLYACIDACTNNIDAKGRTFGCRSFDYSGNICSLFGEVATPRDTRQLKQNFDANYYEKICVENDLMSSECQIINRFPQMILAGFAEAVVTAQSFVECFENCLKSRQLFAMNCTSAIYFYEELEQNCILNSENRQTQKNLFVEENTDIVDYFDISCH